MRATFDWDSRELAEQFLPELNPEAAREAGFDVEQQTLSGGSSGEWELRRSSGGEGYHYVEHDWATDWGSVTEARDEHGDDRKRMRLDLARHRRGSPFLQVLYSIKYMDRWGWDPASGNHSRRIASSSGTPTSESRVEHVPEEERIKSGRSLDYQRIAQLLTDRVYGTQRELAESLDVGRSTVGGWVREEHAPSDAARKKLRRRARQHGLGHYVKTEEHPDGKSADRVDDVDVTYYDPDDRDRRRTIVEYADAPWTTAEGGKSDDEKEYALLNVHTGSYNDAHSEPQLKRVHDEIMEHALEQLSPEPLKLDRETERHHQAVSREQDSINYEDELLDPDESDTYLGGMVDRTSRGQEIEERGLDPRKAILFEVILWTEDMTDVIWHVLGVWNSSVSDSLIVEDSTGWW